jgi:putative nucleotidyltransferase with HDIG domain
MMGHSERVGRFSRSIAEFMNFSQEEVNDLYLAGLLHDIGRIGQNDDIVEVQRGIYRGDVKPIIEHVDLGVKILSGIVGLEHLIPGVEAHHEFWDGSGLPKGLKGEEIPMQGRILCAANVLDEFLHPLVPERQPMSIADAMKSLKLLGGKKLDETVVNAFLVAYRKGTLQI